MSSWRRRSYRKAGELGPGQQALEVGVEADHMLALVDDRGGKPGFGHVDVHNMAAGAVALHVGIKC